MNVKVGHSITRKFTLITNVKSSVDTENYSLLTLSALYGDVEMGQT